MGWNHWIKLGKPKPKPAVNVRMHRPKRNESLTHRDFRSTKPKTAVQAPSSPSKPETVTPIEQRGKAGKYNFGQYDSAAGQPAKKPPSWLADKWNRYGNSGINVATGIALGSMIPLAASKATETDVERMKQYQPQR